MARSVLKCLVCGTELQPQYLGTINTCGLPKEIIDLYYDGELKVLHCHKCMADKKTCWFFMRKNKWYYFHAL